MIAMTQISRKETGASMTQPMVHIPPNPIVRALAPVVATVATVFATMVKLIIVVLRTAASEAIPLTALAAPTAAKHSTRFYPTIPICVIPVL